MHSALPSCFPRGTPKHDASSSALAVSVVLFLSACLGETPNSGIGERKGAKGRVVGYLYDADTGAALTGVTIETMEIGVKVSATSTEGYFTLDKLTASSTYRLTFKQEGYVPRVVNVGLGQVPADAYDAIAVANTGAIAMSHPNGTIKGRVEFATQSAGQAVPIKNASVITSLIGRTGRVRCALDTTSVCGSRGGAQLDDFRVYVK